MGGAARGARILTCYIAALPTGWILFIKISKVFNARV